MTEPNGNGHLAPLEKVDEAVKSLAWYRRVELILVIVTTCAALVAVAFSAYTANQVRSCTVPGGKCYRDNTLRARSSTKGFLEDLDKQHRVLQCMLLTAPDERVPETVAECEEKHK